VTDVYEFIDAEYATVGPLLRQRRTSGVICTRRPLLPQARRVQDVKCDVFFPPTEGDADHPLAAVPGNSYLAPAGKDKLSIAGTLLPAPGGHRLITLCI
jgi:hypothetical protein